VLSFDVYIIFLLSWNTHCRWTRGADAITKIIHDALRGRWSSPTVRCAFRLAKRMSVSTIECSVFLPGQIRSRAVRVPTILEMFHRVSTGTRDWTKFKKLDQGNRKVTVGDKSVKRNTVHRAGAWFQFTSCPYRYGRYAATIAVE
jgi:hypothetical protein